MSWYMNEERTLLQSAFREFAQTRVRPYADKMEREEVDARDLLLEMGQLGFQGMGNSEAYGGAGNDLINVGIMMEELSKESYTFAFLAMIENVFIRGMMAGCTPEQIKKYVVPTMNGEKLMALALNEAPGALFFDGYSTKAVRDGDNWIINGNKCFITLADVTDYYIVIARTGEPVNPLTGEGLVSFIVPADAEGISVGHIEKKVGWKGSHTGTVYFENVKVSDADRTPAPLFVVGANFMGALYAACDLGGAEKCIELTAAFLKGRIQEGGLSVWDAHESIRNKVAELEVKVRVLKMAVYSFLQDFSNGEPDFVDDIALKMEGAKVLEEVSKECMILAGGSGMIYETGIEKYYRDVILSEIGCGANKTFLSVISTFIQ